MKEEHTASRTLVKSAPELWAECSAAASLTRHLGQFGEIKITRLEPETAVAWEGERASGTVRLEPSGWGTQVTLTARAVEAETVAAADPEAEAMAARDPEAEAVAERDPEPEPEPEPEGEPEPRAAGPEPPAVQQPTGLLARLRGLFGGRPGPPPHAQPEPAPPPVEGPVAEEEPVIVEPAVTSPAPPRPAAPPEPVAADPEALLAAALDSLGQAHHRPFSRA